MLAVFPSSQGLVGDFSMQGVAPEQEVIDQEAVSGKAIVVSENSHVNVPAGSVIMSVTNNLLLET